MDAKVIIFTIIELSVCLHYLFWSVQKYFGTKPVKLIQNLVVNIICGVTSSVFAFRIMFEAKFQTRLCHTKFL